MGLARKQISPYRIIPQLQSVEWKEESQGRRDKVRGYRIMSLQDIVSYMQDIIKTPEIEKAVPDLKDLMPRAGMGEPHAQDRLKALVKKILHDKRIHAMPHEILEDMTLPEAVMSMMVGAMYIDDYLKDKDVEEVQVNGTRIYLMKDGVSVEQTRKFDSEEQVMLLQERLSLYGKARISETTPVCSTYMYNKSRLTMTQAPYSAFPTICVRNFILKDPSLMTLVEKLTLNLEMAEFLNPMARYNAGIIVSGGTKTGKTTTLFALVAGCDKNKRILSLETEFEMHLNERLPEYHIVPTQSVPEIDLTMQEAFKPILRMSPERILIGEARGAEMAQGVQAGLRGHDVMMTLHSKYRHMILSDMMDMVCQDGQDHDKGLLKLRIASAFNLIIFQDFIPVSETKMRRVITEITEIVPHEDGRVDMNPLFLWDDEKADWIRTEHKVSKELISHLRRNGASKETLKRYM